tara:strand:+ start:389 stop:655 length:267 start_codon:yes stop_codon:yes gene_type:complete
MSAYIQTVIIEMTQADLLALFSAASLARRQLSKMPPGESEAHNWAADIERAQGRLADLVLQTSGGCPRLARELLSIVRKGEPPRVQPG